MEVRVLVEDVGTAGLDLAVNDLVEEVLSLDDLPGLAHFLVLLVKSLELFSPAVAETLGLVGAEERPVSVRLDTLHEEVGDPETKEEVASTLLLLTVVLLQLFK